MRQRETKGHNRLGPVKGSTNASSKLTTTALKLQKVGQPFSMMLEPRFSFWFMKKVLEQNLDGQLGDGTTTDARTLFRYGGASAGRKSAANNDVPRSAE